ncbi:MAG: hypothetical protein NTU85_03750 [Candidatus Kaiserbacteria bacterium]|nr:hypothetical protein [Candidatus Kaiserbacteria bacterium]
MASFNLSITPNQTELVAKPGAVFIQAYSVTNKSDATIFLTSSLKPWLPTGLNGAVDYLHAVSNPYLSFSLQNADLALNQSFYLKSGESKQLVLKIKLDSSAPLGDSYYTFFISQNTNNQIGGLANLSSFSGQIGSHLLISTSDVANPAVSASITNARIAPRFKDLFFTPLTFQADINNESGFYFATPLKISLKKGNTTINEAVLPAQNVLAHYSRHFQTQLNPPFWPGAYTATYSLDPGLNTPPVTVSFYIFPYSLVIIIIFITLVALLLTRLLKAKNNHPT